MPTPPSVDVITGAVTPVNSPIYVNTSFTYTCTSAAQGTTITVTPQLMGNGQPWFSPSSVTFVTPSGSPQVTPQGLGSWGWNAQGVNVQPSARVHVISTMPGEGDEGHEHHEHGHHEHEKHEHQEHGHKKAS
jgi:hypothetical protein